MSVICCFHFLGVVDGDHCRGFGVILNIDRSSCVKLTTTPFHSFTRPPFTSWRTFTASPSLKDEGQSGSDILAVRCLQRCLVDTPAKLCHRTICCRCQHTAPEYDPSETIKHTALEYDPSEIIKHTALEYDPSETIKCEPKHKYLYAAVAPATRPSPSRKHRYRFSTTPRVLLPLQHCYRLSVATATAPLPHHLSPSRSCRVKSATPL